MSDLKITMNSQSKKKYGLMKSLVRKNCRKKNAIRTFLTWLVQSSLFNEFNQFFSRIYDMICQRPTYLMMTIKMNRLHACVFCSLHIIDIVISNIIPFCNIFMHRFHTFLNAFTSGFATPSCPLVNTFSGLK